MLSGNTPRTDLTETGEEVVIRLHLDDMKDAPIVHVEDFGSLLRVRGQDQARKQRAFSKTIPIIRGSERPTASFQNGMLQIRIKKTLTPDQTTNPIQ